MTDIANYGFYIPPGMEFITVSGQVFYTDVPHTEYERQVGAALRAAILQHKTETDSY